MKELNFQAQDCSYRINHSLLLCTTYEAKLPESHAPSSCLQLVLAYNYVNFIASQRSFDLFSTYFIFLCICMRKLIVDAEENTRYASVH